MIELANSDSLSAGWIVAFNVLNLAVSIALAVGMYWLNLKTHRIETLEEKLEAKATELVNTVIAQRVAELNTTIQVLANSLAQVERRLQRGDESFETIEERWRAMELRLVERLASKDDLRALSDKMEKLGERFGGLQVAVARMEAKGNE